MAQRKKSATTKRRRSIDARFSVGPAVVSAPSADATMDDVDAEWNRLLATADFAYEDTSRSFAASA